MRSFRIRVQPARASTLALLALAVAGLSGCNSLLSSDNSLLGFITPYRIEVVQGLSLIHI